jgi:stage IV sporulation protein FB
MLTFELFRIPVRVQFFFWLTAFFLAGGLGVNQAEEWVPLLMRVGIIFFSILIHELGHAWASRHWNGQPMVELHGLGGVTFLGGWRFSRWQHLAITTAGPAASLGLAGVSFLLLNFTTLPLRMGLEYALFINLVWTAFNLLPILPMDGGQILRDLIGPRHERVCRIIGMLTALAVGLWAYQKGQYFTAVMLGIFAWLNMKGSIRAGGVQ